MREGWAKPLPLSDRWEALRPGGSRRRACRPPHLSLEEQLQINSLWQQVGCSPAATRSASARKPQHARRALAINQQIPSVMRGRWGRRARRAQGAATVILCNWQAGVIATHCVPYSTPGQTVNRSLPWKVGAATGWRGPFGLTRCRLLTYGGTHSCVSFIDRARALMKKSERNLHKPCWANKLDKSLINSFTSHNVNRETPAECRQLKLPCNYFFLLKSSHVM